MKLSTVLAAAMAVALLAACSDATTTGSGASAVSRPPAVTTTGLTPPAANPVKAAGVAPSKVSANTATRAQMQATFEAAGIPNAARMAGEVEEYRPYPTNDPTFAKLRKELAKYRIADQVVDQIIATLAL